MFTAHPLLMQLAGVDAARGDRHRLAQRSPGLVEEDAVLKVLPIEVLAADIVVAFDRVGIAFELAHHRPGVDVINAGQARPFRYDAERYSVRLLPRIGGM